MDKIDGIGNLKKKSENFTFKFYKNFDILQIQTHILDYKDEWTMDTSRQDTHDSHKYTNAYFIVEHRNDWLYGDKYLPELVCRDAKLWEMIKPIVQDLELYIDVKELLS